MRINDIINEEQISEIPVGIGARLATAAKAINPFSTSGRNLAQGSQVSNKKANELYAAYYKWVGQRNMPTDAESVTAFLTAIRAPAAAIQAAKLKLVAPEPTPEPVPVPEPTVETKRRTLEAAPGVALDKKIIGSALLAAAQAYGSTPAPVAPKTTDTTPAPTDTTPAPGGGAMKGAQIAAELKAVWDKATADPGSMTGDGVVRQQIISMAKTAGMTGMKIESVGYSRFLGMKI